MTTMLGTTRTHTQNTSQVMEQRSTDMCVIFAGYKDRMDQFFSYIPGMQSRVNLHIVRGAPCLASLSSVHAMPTHTPHPATTQFIQDFPDMEEDDLVSVGKLMFNNMEYKLAADAEPALRECVACALACAYA